MPARGLQPVIDRCFAGRVLSIPAERPKVVPCRKSNRKTVTVRVAKQILIKAQQACAEIYFGEGKKRIQSWLEAYIDGDQQ